MVPGSYGPVLYYFTLQVKLIIDTWITLASIELPQFGQVL